MDSHQQVFYLQILLFPLLACGVAKQADLLAVMLVGPIRMYGHVGSGTWIEGQ